MQKIYKTWFTSIGKKQIVAISGLLLCFFLVSHLIGNLLIIINIQIFNEYAEKLITHPLIIPAEIALATIFLLHISFAIIVTIEDFKARPVAYKYPKKSEGRKSFASDTMIYTGSLIFTLLIVHIVYFKYGRSPNLSLGEWVTIFFYSLNKVLWFVFFLIALGLHLSHGAWSALQTLGFSHDKYTPLIKILTYIFAWIIAFGFILIPVTQYLVGKNIL